MSVHFQTFTFDTQNETIKNNKYGSQKFYGKELDVLNGIDSKIQ